MINIQQNSSGEPAAAVLNGLLVSQLQPLHRLPNQDDQAKFGDLRFAVPLLLKASGCCPAFEDSRSTLWPWGVMDSAPLVVGHFQGHPRTGLTATPSPAAKATYIYCPPPINISDWKWNFQSRKCNGNASSVYFKFVCFSLQNEKKTDQTPPATLYTGNLLWPQFGK